MPTPDNVTNLLSFLGLANYYSMYILKIHDLRAPFNELLKKGRNWYWTKECKNNIQRNKIMLIIRFSINALWPEKGTNYYSKYSIGAVLLYKFEDGSTILFVHMSRSLLQAEKNYSQIEKEGLAIIKFHRFIHGRSFILQTDHKPLLAIFGSKKGIPSNTTDFKDGQLYYSITILE